MYYTWTIKMKMETSPLWFDTIGAYIHQEIKSNAFTNQRENVTWLQSKSKRIQEG